MYLVRIYSDNMENNKSFQLNSDPSRSEIYSLLIAEEEEWIRSMADHIYEMKNFPYIGPGTSTIVTGIYSKENKKIGTLKIERNV